MTLLYRSPDVTIDGTRWHLAVRRSPQGRRASLCYRWHDGRAYRSSAEAVRIPKGLAQTMRPYRKHADVAMQYGQFQKGAS
jgi:hypothetical protein